MSKSVFIWSNGKRCAHQGTKGRLGLRMSRDFNMAFLAKLAWQMLIDSDKLWVQVMKDKYVRSGNFLTATTPNNASWGWRSIMKGKATIELGAQWRIGNGKLLIFWSDWWVEDKLLGLDNDDYT